MKLTYRGNSYDSTPNPAPKLGKTIDTGNYRGAPVVFKALAEVPAQPANDLTWRGVPYRTGIAAPVMAPAILPAVAASIAAPVAEPVAVQVTDPVAEPVVTASNIPNLARNLFIRRHQRSRRREQGMMVRLAAEVGMPVEDAAHYESHIQGKIPHDFSGYDRGSSSMS